MAEFSPTGTSHEVHHRSCPACKNLEILGWLGTRPPEKPDFFLDEAWVEYHRTHFENPWLTAWVMHPGFVQTDNGDALARLFGMPQAPDTLERSVAGLLGRVDGATRAGTSGKFLDIDGAELAF